MLVTRTLALGAAVLLVSLPIMADDLLVEDFEDDGLYEYTITNGFVGEDPITLGPALWAHNFDVPGDELFDPFMTGTGYFVGQAVNKHPIVSTDFFLDLNAVDVSGYTNLQLTASLAASPLDFEDNDFLKIFVDVNNDGTYEDPMGVSNNEPIAAFYGDNFTKQLTDGVTDLNATFQDVTFDIPVDGPTPTDVVVRFDVLNSVGNETVGIDHVRVTGDLQPGSNASHPLPPDFEMLDGSYVWEDIVDDCGTVSPNTGDSGCWLRIPVTPRTWNDVQIQVEDVEASRFDEIGFPTWENFKQYGNYSPIPATYPWSAEDKNSELLFGGNGSDPGTFWELPGVGNPTTGFPTVFLDIMMVYPDGGEEFFPLWVATSGTTVIVTVEPTLPGDGNGDGWVDGLDYLLWAANYNEDPSDPPGPEGGDYNLDGVTDGLDYLLWAGEYGNHLSTAVPEPTTFTFTTLAWLSLYRPRRRR